MASTVSPNMGLIVPTVGSDPSPDWANNLNASLSIIDQHNHSNGSGVQIQPSGLNISSDLTFQNNQATNLKAAVFSPQGSLATLEALYVIGVDLYYNDGAGNVVQMTAGGSVNATSSGISDGTATAAFSAGTLVVNEASNTPGNIQCGSVLIGNNSAGSKFVTLQPQLALASNYALTLPLIPGATNFLSIDSSGNIAAATPYPLTAAGLASGAVTGAKIAAGTITGSNIAATTITGSNIAATTIDAGRLVSGTLTGTQMSSNINLPGKSVQANNQNVIVSNANATNGLSMLRALVASGGTLGTGEGFSAVSQTSTGVYHLVYSTAFADGPSVSANVISGNPNFCSIISSNSTDVTVHVYDLTGTLTSDAFSVTIIGQRA